MQTNFVATPLVSVIKKTWSIISKQWTITMNIFLVTSYFFDHRLENNIVISINTNSMLSRQKMINKD